MPTFEQKAEYLATGGAITEQMRINAQVVLEEIESGNYENDPDIELVKASTNKDYRAVMAFDNKYF